MSLAELLRAAPGTADLSSIDTRGTPGLPARRDPKEWAREQLAVLGTALAEQQEMLYASAKAAGDKRRVLLVLQAMDCGGKDGAIKRVAGAMNPLGVHIVAFGPPTDEERRHDFLWRIRRALPAPGYVGIFNRSHYEEVLVPRVHGLVPEATWQARYEKINQFERRLVDDGCTLLKVLLHISPEEQRERLLRRLTDPTKFWKYDPADLEQRAHWDDYQAAYADALNRCNPDHAPWYVVPADRKWYRDWAVATLLLGALRGLRLRYPAAGVDVAAERARLAGAG